VVQHSRVGSPPAVPLRGLRDDPPPCPPRALRARPRRRRTIAGGNGEAEREGASAASGCGGEGAGPEVPEGGSERGVVAGGGPKGGANPLRVPIAVKGKEWATQAQEIDAAPRRPTKTEFVAFPPKRESSRLAPTPNASKQASQRWGRSSAQLRIKCENAG
jgi:hypothetical protein